MKNYKVLWLIILILILVVGSLTVVLFLNIIQLNNLRTESTSLEGDYSSLEDEFFSLVSDLESIQQNLTTTSLELVTCNDQLSEAKDNIQAIDLEMQDLTQSSQERYEDLESNLISSRDQLASNIRKLSDLREIEDKYNQLICDSDLIDQFNMDYSSIQSSSSRLQGFVANLPGTDHISYAIRNTLWNNADSKIHGIRYVSDDGNTYSTQFLVYVNELAMKQGTFYIDDQCWLDPP